ncbi:hypothetical protein [Pseudomonas halotolerans]|uniref:hypothetical protein n=1 Tax=Pseudomonas halotolerans TaxID=3143552 RepID=UPI0031DCB00A
MSKNQADQVHCYHCEGDFTGWEHVPPQSFFFKGERGGLITVPSCDLHNQKKSKDDEYIRAILLSSAKLDDKPHLAPLRDVHERALWHAGNRLGDCIKDKQQAKKILDIIEKHTGDPVAGMKSFSDMAQAGIGTGLLGLLSVDLKDETIVDANGEEQQTSSFVYDRQRFDNFFECIAKGLFYHEAKWTWLGKVILLPHTFLRDDASDAEKKLSDHFRQMLNRQSAKGEHKEVFFYDVLTVVDPDTNDPEKYIINFCFFDTFEFTAVLSKENFIPYKFAAK